MAKQTLVNQAKETSPAEVANGGIMKMPDILNSAPDIIQPETPISPYVIFASSKREDVWNRLLRTFPDLEEGSPVLIINGNTKPVLLRPFRFNMIAMKQYFGISNARGELIEASYDEVPGDNRWKEFIDSVILIYLPHSVVPARCTFKSSKCPAARQAFYEGWKAAETAEWANKSEAHKLTLSLPDPKYRYIATARITARTSARGEGAGMRYFLCEADIAPIDAGNVKLLKDFLTNPESVAEINKIAEHYSQRLKDVERKIKA